MELAGRRRIIIVGNNGSGKSWLARELGAVTGLPVIHLDTLFWGPGWTMPPEDTWRETQRALTRRERWIIDGNHCATMEVRFQAADLVIFLDYSRPACQLGILRRTGAGRPDMPAHLQEKMDLAFWRFCGRMWRFPKTGRRTILGLHERYPETPFVVIKNRRRLNRMLARWRMEAP